MSLLPASRLGSATALFPCDLIAKTSQQEARPRILSLAMQGREDRVPWVDLRAGDGRGQRRGGPARGRGGGRGDSFEPRAPRNDRMVPWSRGDDGIKEMDEEAIEEQLQRRERAKRNRDFEMADAIRDDLLLELGVHVDDHRRIWWPDGTKPQDIEGEGWVPAGGRTPEDIGWTRGEPLDVPADESKILELLSARDAARRARDFSLADSLMDTLREQGVAYADDANKVFTMRPPPGKQNRRSGDWDCPDCQALVYSTKNQCFRCGAARPL
eukprot:CAMPEP_0177707100 /NCGR_PEP_ID=MMETSP0484_2-20121128/9571_1 /TAXON_ID=354590 /ORGANISM="Rhodomonas lens, Strain RHODO" /LENGTH=269 /DNA_ID=CAMNT_0019218591 /DNA_START=96 /DNA_END=902 /DNA_ORIENTATION=-